MCNHELAQIHTNFSFRMEIREHLWQFAVKIKINDQFMVNLGELYVFIRE